MSRGSGVAEGHRPVVLRGSGAVLVPVAVWVVCAVVVVDSLVEGDAGADQVRTAVAMVSIAFLAWMFLFSPSLVVERGGLRVVNPLRVHWVPFSALDDVVVRGLTTLVVRSSSGRLRRITSWNAPGVPRTFAAATPPVAEAIELRRSSWERSGSVDPGAGLSTSWRWRPLLVLLLVVAVQVTVWWQ